MPKKRKYGTFSGTLDELKSGQFFANAQMRSSRRKSPWNLLLVLVLPLWLILWWQGLKLARILATALLHGHTRRTRTGSLTHLLECLHSGRIRE